MTAVAFSDKRHVSLCGGKSTRKMNSCTIKTRFPRSDLTGTTAENSSDALKGSIMQVIMYVHVGVENLACQRHLLALLPFVPKTTQRALLLICSKLQY
jgi:hypothetical protein